MLTNTTTQKMSLTTYYIPFLLVVFILTGVFIPLTIEVITLNGGCQQSTFIIALPGSIGMVCASYFKKPSFSHGTIQWKFILIIALLEFFSQALILDGLMAAGSAIYTVVYSSVTVYTALLAYFFLHRHLHIMQWVGVLIVFLGLAVVSIGAKNDGSDVLYGVVLILTGSLSHASMYVVSEYLLMWCDDPISPDFLCFLQGSLGTTINLLWQFVYTYPRFHQLVVEEIVNHGGSIKIILGSYLLLTILAGLHGMIFYELLGSIGSVSTGVCKGVQSVLVFIASHWAFCNSRASECFSRTKALSLLIVSLGVYLYSHFSYKPHKYPLRKLTFDASADEESRSFLLHQISLPLSPSPPVLGTGTTETVFNSIEGASPLHYQIFSDGTNVDRTYGTDAIVTCSPDAQSHRIE